MPGAPRREDRLVHQRQIFTTRVKPVLLDKSVTWPLGREDSRGALVVLRTMFCGAARVWQDN